MSADNRKGLILAGLLALGLLWQHHVAHESAAQNAYETSVMTHTADLVTTPAANAFNRTLKTASDNAARQMAIDAARRNTSANP